MRYLRCYSKRWSHGTCGELAHLQRHFSWESTCCGPGLFGAPQARPSPCRGHSGGSGPSMFCILLLMLICFFAEACTFVHCEGSVT
jgi:hypothetical protein